MSGPGRGPWLRLVRLLTLFLPLLVLDRTFLRPVLS
jgi:hypothetical protein